MTAIDKALYYLNIKPRTRQQVIDYLQKKEFEQDEIDAAVRELEEYRYIDDYNYCQLYFEMGFEKSRGIGRIKRELLSKGVDKEIIEEALENMGQVPDQYDMARQLAESILQTLHDEDKQKLKAKLARRLAGRGFAADVVYRTVNQVIR
ncbi:MAG: RecX family transcriptional regulator [Bacillota bacterium]|nr:RecX family transcriptional regulator [Bacillota bacterium]